MKALSVRQPFAELIATGRKTLEIRTRRTHYRGPLLICSGGAWHRLGVHLHGQIGERGVAVCVVNLSGCRQMTEADREAACLPETFDVRGQFCWILSDPRRVQAVPINGRLGIFELPSPVPL